MYFPRGTSRSKPLRLFCRTPRRRMHSSLDGATVSGEITRPRSEQRTEMQLTAPVVSRFPDFTGGKPRSSRVSVHSDCPRLGLLCHWFVPNATPSFLGLAMTQEV